MVGYGTVRLYLVMYGFVIGPTIPSATRPLAVWNALIAEVVYGPCIPSTVPV